jgi:hypothetical protein
MLAAGCGTVDGARYDGRKPAHAGWLAERYGRPLALYTDKNSLFHTSRLVQWQEQLHGQPARTQFGRALAELGMKWGRGPKGASSDCLALCRIVW